MSKLRIGPDLTLPVDAVTQAIGILAKRRVGKSYTARRFAEQLYKAGQQIVIVDPKGDWWGIRSSADGKSPGLSVVILGGERGDVPLEVGGGEIVAKLVVEERVSVLLDLSLFRKHEVATFMTAFLENLYRLKAKETNRTPVMLITDEADAIMPQKPQPNEARMLGAGEDIVRRGGQRGIGCMLITQRSAVLNKNVLTQCEMIVALRTIAPQDLKALDAWVEVHGEQEQRDTLMASLPSLPVGDAWFWSPGWPTTDGIFKRVHVSPIETFDSGASPKAGEKRVEPKNLADVDLGALTKKMAATIERAKADDPKELKKQLAERDRTIRQLEKGTAVKTVEKAVRDEVAIERAVAAAVAAERKKFRPVLVRLQKLSTALTEVPAAIGELAKLADAPAPQVSVPIQPARASVTAERTPSPARRQSESSSSSSLGRGERTILAAIAQYPDGAARDQLTVLTGYKRSSRDTYIQRLSSAGYVDAANGGIRATNEGIAALGEDYEPLPQGADLRDYWLRRLPEGERRVFEVVVAGYPEAVSREAIDEATGYKRSSRDTYLQRLGSRRLVESVGRGEVRASRTLF